MTTKTLDGVAPDALRAKIIQLSKSEGVYGNTPDDWCPFERQTTVLGHIKKAGLQPLSVTSLIKDWSDYTDVRDQLKKSTIVIIDPMFLTRADIKADVFSVMDATIADRDGAFFCIARHRAIPVSDHGYIDKVGREKLPLCFREYQAGSGSECRAEDLERFNVSLFRISRKMSEDLPNQENKALAGALLAQNGARPTSLPILGGR